MASNNTTGLARYVKLRREFKKYLERENITLPSGVFSKILNNRLQPNTKNLPDSDVFNDQCFYDCLSKGYTDDVPKIPEIYKSEFSYFDIESELPSGLKLPVGLLWPKDLWIYSDITIDKRIPAIKFNYDQLRPWVQEQDRKRDEREMKTGGRSWSLKMSHTYNGASFIWNANRMIFCFF
mgnify:CR=1 FL=1